MRHPLARLAAPVLLLVFANAATAQSFADFCPNGNPETQAAVVGYVTDPDVQSIVPAATVAASWVEDNARQRLEVQTNLEGLYIMCGIPSDIEVSLRVIFGNRRGEIVPYAAATPLAQQDMFISLTGDPEAREEVGSLADGGGGGSGRAYSSELIRAEDLLYLPEMSVYELLRRHQLLRFERVSGQGEVILLVSATSSSTVGRMQAVQMRINERREADPIGAIRDLSIDEVNRIEILTRTEASARYGGDGYVGAIAITIGDR